MLMCLLSSSTALIDLRKSCGPRLCSHGRATIPSNRIRYILRGRGLGAVDEVYGPSIRIAPTSNINRVSQDSRNGEKTAGKRTLYVIFN